MKPKTKIGIEHIPKASAIGLEIFLGKITLARAARKKLQQI